MKSECNSLYNKYRPDNYNSVIGQEPTSRTLKSIVNNKSYNFNRNYIFHSSIGGVGKTTMALIFAKAINCMKAEDGEPCNICPNCIAFDKRQYSNLIYIKGNEYNSLDKVKPIIDIAKQPPISTKNEMKIVIIDEVQRMSPEAMAEFLDLFEFSYNKTVFILTTTNINKVLQPLRTRCFQFELVPTSTNAMSKNLATICEKENISYNSIDLEKIAEESNGSMRDAIQLMSKYYEAYGEIKDLPISFQYDTFSELIDFCLGGDIEELQNKLIHIPMADIYSKFSKFLFQRYLKTKCNKPVDSFLKYKPTDYNSMLLYFVQLNEEMGKTESTKPITPSVEKIYTPIPVKLEIDRTPLLVSNGFYKS